MKVSKKLVNCNRIKANIFTFRIKYLNQVKDQLFYKTVNLYKIIIYHEQINLALKIIFGNQVIF